MAEAPVAQVRCTHLDQVRPVTPSAEGCEDCLKIGDTWVHLRMCLICGHVGCCNESKNRHASAHFHQTSHPLVRSFEPGEDWMWCYADELALAPQGDVIGKEFSTEFMRRHPLFEGLDDENLDQLYRMTEPAFIPAGEVFIREGEIGDSLYVVLEGEIEVSKRDGDQDVVLAIRGPGEFVGELALLTDEPRFATVRTLKDTSLLVISKSAFDTLLECNPSVPLTMLRTMMQRLRSNEVLLMQREKMAALGTMAAGLAHELNNPAAAIWRSSEQLHDSLADWERLTAQLGGLSLDTDQMATIESLRAEAAKRAGAPTFLDPLARSDREDELQDWLEEQDVDQPWEIAPALVAAGWERATLEPLVEPFAPDQIVIVLRWLAIYSGAYGLLAEIGTSAAHISEIVKGVKSYTHLDQGRVQTVDVHESLDNTLVILHHKLKGGISVVREYGDDVPKIDAHGSELNQVWTNIIDNSVDAMNGQGTLTLHTYMKDGKVVVEIQDSGPGIPEEIQSRIFDPLFTTKDVGKGTGLGLHIAYNIVVAEHRGNIEVISHPGSTCFRISLPTQLS